MKLKAENKGKSANYVKNVTVYFPPLLHVYFFVFVDVFQQRGPGRF